jgi:hypothetical protein
MGWRTWGVKTPRKLTPAKTHNLEWLRRWGGVDIEEYKAKRLLAIQRKLNKRVMRVLGKEAYTVVRFADEDNSKLSIEDCLKILARN